MFLQPANYRHAETAFLKNLPEIRARQPRYEAYFEWLKPRSVGEVFQRGLFAFASVHTTWESNCKLYEAIRAYENWLHNDAALKDAIVSSRAELHNNRTKFIGRFGRLFWSNPAFFSPKAGERWSEFRARVLVSLDGLGPAKSAFFLELLYFHESEIVCTDTHMLQMYGVLPKNVGNATGETYDDLERHWRNMCLDCGVRPVTARWCLWDVKQGKSDSRYWSYVLEAQ